MLSCLLRRGILAAQTPHNAPGFDVLATKGGYSARIRVKTRTTEYPDWQWVAKPDGAIFRNFDPDALDDFTVLVALPPDHGGHVYVVPTRLIDEWLRKDFEQWLAEPGKRGKPHSPTNRKRHLSSTRYASILTPYENGWDGLWSGRAGTTPDKHDDMTIQKAQEVPEAAPSSASPRVNKSARIRELAEQGMPRAEIARHLGIRYQFVRNVLTRPLKGQ